MNTDFSMPTKKLFGRKPGGTIKYGSDGLEGCVLAAAMLAVSLTSPLELAREMLMELLMETFLLELATERSCDELPTYKSPDQQDPPYEIKSDRPKRDSKCM